MKELWIGVAVVEHNEGWKTVITPLVWAGFCKSEGDVLVRINHMAKGRKICYQYAYRYESPGQDVELAINELGHIFIKET